MIDTLLELGFSKNDSTVYSALVEVGPCFVAPLVRQTKKHRQIVYNSLTTLVSHQLVSVSEKNGKNFYSITDPHRLLANIKQKEIMAESLIKTIEEKQKNDLEQVEIFSGSTSYERGTFDFRRRAFEAKEYIVIRTETKAWFEQVRSFFSLHVSELKKLKKAGSDIFIIFFEDERDLALKFLGDYLGDPYTCKIIPDEYKVPNTIWLAGDHVYVVTPAADPLVIHIRSKVLANQCREYFWRVWSKGNILTK